MANELTVAVKATYDNGGTTFTAPDAAARSISINVTGDNVMHNRQTIGTSEEALVLGDVATGGYFIAVNRDDANFVELRSGTGATDFIRLKAGEVCLFRVSPDAMAPYAIADTAACELEYWLLEV